MSGRKGQPAAGMTTFLGIAGVYTGFWGVMENRRWLYAPVRGADTGLVCHPVRYAPQIAAAMLPHPVIDRNAAGQDARRGIESAGSLKVVVVLGECDHGGGC